MVPPPPSPATPVACSPSEATSVNIMPAGSSTGLTPPNSRRPRPSLVSVNISGLPQRPTVAPAPDLATAAQAASTSSPPSSDQDPAAQGSNAQSQSEPQHAGPPPWANTTTCKWWAAGYCARGQNCWYRHGHDEASTSSPPGSSRPPATQPTPSSTALAPSKVQSSLSPSAPLFQPALPVLVEDLTAQAVEEVTPQNPQSDPDAQCVICYETPEQFGLLESCSHCFCLECIRQWRRASEKKEATVPNDTTKTCPACRKVSLFVIPSQVFHPEGPAKQETMRRYKESMARKPCRNFEESKNFSQGPWCPFGDECHYKHCLTDGDDRYVFGGGFQEMQRRKAAQRLRWAIGARRRRDGATATSGRGEAFSDLQGALDHLTRLFDHSTWGDETDGEGLAELYDPAAWDEELDFDNVGADGPQPQRRRPVLEQSDQISGPSPAQLLARISASRESSEQAPPLSSGRSQRRRAQRMYNRSSPGQTGDPASQPRSSDATAEDFERSQHTHAQLAAEAAEPDPFGEAYREELNEQAAIEGAQSDGGSHDGGDAFGLRRAYLSGYERATRTEETDGRDTDAISATHDLDGSSDEGWEEDEWVLDPSDDNSGGGGMIAHGHMITNAFSSDFDMDDFEDASSTLDSNPSSPARNDPLSPRPGHSSTIEEHDTDDDFTAMEASFGRMGFTREGAPSPDTPRGAPGDADSLWTSGDVGDCFQF